MNKHGHIRHELKQILESVSGLTVVSVMTSGQEPDRPFARIRKPGWQRAGFAEKESTKGDAIWMVEVYIRSDEGTEGLEAECDRLDELIEHAFDRYAMSAHNGELYTVSDFTHEYLGASGVLDQNNNLASFGITLSVTWQQTPNNN